MAMLAMVMLKFFKVHKLNSSQVLLFLGSWPKRDNLQIETLKQCN